MRRCDATFDYLILGNSAAAVAAAESIRQTDTSATLALVSPEACAAYGTPLISYLLEGKTTVEKMALRKPGFYDELGAATFFGEGCAAVSIDASAHVVQLEDGRTLGYGKLLVATGSVPFTPPIEGLAGATNVSTFLTLDDALACAEGVKAATEAAHAAGRPSRTVVVGAGLIGLKAAEALSGFADETVVLEMAPRILPAVLDQTGAQIMLDLLAKRGLTCLPGVTASQFEQDAKGAIVAAQLTDGTALDCDFVVAAVGVRPNAALLEAAGAAMGRGVEVGTDLQTSLADVYAAGDVTQTVDLLDGSKKPLALWPNAVRQGRLAGLHMAGAEQAVPFEGNFAVNSVDFFDEVYLLTAGIINPAPDAGYDELVLVEDDTYAKFVTKDDRLFGYITLNRPENAGIYTAIIERKIPLSLLAEDMFLRAPQDIDIAQPLQWARLHIGYPGGCPGEAPCVDAATADTIREEAR